jgi:hypothetical protein
LDLNQRTASGTPPPCLAAANPPALAALVAARRCDLAAADAKGQTVAHFAARDEWLQQLLDALAGGGVDFYAADGAGLTPMGHALRGGCFGNALRLVELSKSRDAVVEVGEEVLDGLITGGGGGLEFAAALVGEGLLRLAAVPDLGGRALSAAVGRRHAAMARACLEGGAIIPGGMLTSLAGGEGGGVHSVALTRQRTTSK